MDKVVFVFVFCLCFERYHQENVTVEDQLYGNKIKNSSLAPRVRTFLGRPVVETEVSSELNRTGPSPSITSGSTPSHPHTLTLSSNRTASYLQGSISTVLIPVLYILTLALGVPANLFTLCTLASKVRKVPSAILYCSLAVSDLLLLLSLVFRAHYHLHGNHWVFGETACRVVTACFYGNLYCSAQTLASISALRYLAVGHPFLYRSLPKRTCTTWATLVLWMVLGVGLVPELLVHQSYRIQPLGIVTCHDILPLELDSHQFLLYYNLVLTLFGLLLPLLVSVVCFVRILAELNQSHCDWGLYIRSSSLVFLIFLVCFTPAGVLHFIHSVQLFSNGTEDLYMYFNVAVCLCCLHAAMDPFLFMLMSRSTGSNPYFRALRSKSVSVD